VPLAYRWRGKVREAVVVSRYGVETRAAVRISDRKAALFIGVSNIVLAS
jgi:hypothetical protein